MPGTYVILNILVPTSLKCDYKGAYLMELLWDLKCEKYMQFLEQFLAHNKN